MRAGLVIPSGAVLTLLVITVLVAPTADARDPFAIVCDLLGFETQSGARAMGYCIDPKDTNEPIQRCWADLATVVPAVLSRLLP
jgi:hypothetical protein